MMNFTKISVEESQGFLNYSSKTPSIDTGNNFLKVQTVKDVEDPIPLASTNESMDNAIPHFIYGFIVFLGICIVLSLGRAIYYYISISIGSNTETSDGSTTTESPSISSRPSTSRNQEVENTDECNTERLNTQLEKLRKLLNDMNARLGVSRDTIVFPAASAPFVGNSRQSSSDLDTLWSSIDFDDFESTIYDYNTRKTPTDLSVSPSISYSSLDVSRSLLPSNRSSSIAIFPKLPDSRPIPRQISNLSTPSNAINQLLELLDSFIPKSGNTSFPLKTISDCRYSEKTPLASVEIELKPSPYRSTYVFPALPSSTSAFGNQLPSTSRLSPSEKSQFMTTTSSEPVHQKISVPKFNFANLGTKYSENDSSLQVNDSSARNQSHKNVLPHAYASVEQNTLSSALKFGNISSISESVDKITLSLSYETAHGKTSSSEFFDVKMSSSSASEEQEFASVQSLKEKYSILFDSLQPTKVPFMSSSMIKKLPISSSEPVVSQIVLSSSKLVEMRRSLSETQLFDGKNELWSSDSTDFLKLSPTFLHTNISSSESTSLLSVTPQSETQQILATKSWNFPKNNITENYKTPPFHKTKSDRLLKMTSENLKSSVPLNSQNLLQHLSLQNKSVKSEITTPFSESLSPEIQFTSTPFANETPIIKTVYAINETNWRTPLGHYSSPTVTHVTNETCNKSPYLLNSNAWSTPPAP